MESFGGGLAKYCNFCLINQKLIALCFPQNTFAVAIYLHKEVVENGTSLSCDSGSGCLIYIILMILVWLFYRKENFERITL